MKKGHCLFFIRGKSSSLFKLYAGLYALSCHLLEIIGSCMWASFHVANVVYDLTSFIVFVSP